jgi:hypothetical protein
MIESAPKPKSIKLTMMQSFEAGKLLEAHFTIADGAKRGARDTVGCFEDGWSDQRIAEAVEYTGGISAIGTLRCRILGKTKPYIRAQSPKPDEFRALTERVQELEAQVASIMETLTKPHLF